MKRYTLQLKIVSLALIVLGSGNLLLGQVGIGNPSPDSTSVLDLTNPNNKGLVLPPATSPASFSTSLSLGMTYFSGDQIFYKRSDGYNALSPWKYKFNGNASEDVYYNAGGNIGIGSTSLLSRPSAPLHIETDSSVSLAGNGSMMIGNTLSNNLALNSQEIQTRNLGSPAELGINEDGGDVTFGGSPSPVDVKVSGKNQELHQPTGNYADLVPRGSIIMWFGTTTDVPEGWAICDGGTYSRSDNNGTVTTPDLSGKFVVGVGNGGGQVYSAHATGGQDSVALTVSEIPAHDHNVRDLGHTHGYTDKFQNNQISDDANDRNVSDDSETTENKTTSTGFANIAEDQTGGGQAHENRPSFHALVYIMKL